MNIVQSGLLLTFCTPFVTASWIALKHRRRGAPSATRVEADGGNGGYASTIVDLEAAVAEAAEDLGGLAQEQWVRIDLAVSPAMTVHADPNVLATALRETMTTAIRATPGGQVLVTAETLGNQLHIRISDDGWGEDQRLRESLVRDAGALIALQGGSVAVHATPGRGTTVTVRIPMPINEREEIDRLRELADLEA